MSPEENVLCNNTSNNDQSAFNKDNFLLIDQAMTTLCISQRFQLKKNLYNSLLQKITRTAISMDHTFKVNKNIGFAR